MEDEAEEVYRKSGSTPVESREELFSIYGLAFLIGHLWRVNRNDKYEMTNEKRICHHSLYGVPSVEVSGDELWMSVTPLLLSVE